MKRVLFSLLVLGTSALGAIVDVTNEITLSGNDHSDDRLDFKFGDSTNRTITLTTTANATITGTNGYGLSDANNVLNFNITGTLSATGEVKGTIQGQFNITTAVTADEITSIKTNGMNGRDIVTANFISCLGNKAAILTLNLQGLDGYVDGGKLVKFGSSYYSLAEVTMNGSYWELSSGATAVNLEDGHYYTYITITARSGAAPKAIGYVATAIPEPTTGVLSVFALAGLAARRRRKA